MNKTVKEKLLEKFQGYEEERRNRYLDEREQRDREWAIWIDSADATYEVLRDPGLAVKPSDRLPPTGAELLRIMIAERKKK